MKEKFLPLGTVCMLKGGEKAIMIVGYCPQAQVDGQSKVFDYTACMYPEGILSSDQNLVFNHEQIDKIIREITPDQETLEFMKVLKEYLKQYNQQIGNAGTTDNSQSNMNGTSINGEGSSNNGVINF